MSERHGADARRFALGGMAAFAAVCFAVRYCSTDEELPKRRASRRSKRVSKRGASFQAVSDEELA